MSLHGIETTVLDLDWDKISDITKNHKPKEFFVEEAFFFPTDRNRTEDKSTALYAKKTGITPGTIHHYESLIKTLAPTLKANVKSKELTFKEARSIADIDDYDRQIQLAKPFLKGELSSVHVEKIVSLAKKHPSTEVRLIIESVTKGKQIVEEKKPEPEKKVIDNPIDFSSIDARILKLSAEIDLIQSEEIPEFKRLKLISSLRILQSRTQLALSSLNTKAESFNLLDSKLLKK